ncbi:MAG: hypothetical protein KDK35_21730, partial [Leptospiraceae bacterium]|nr:hypothetical protein [Leptospiraceae bacterium]
ALLRSATKERRISRMMDVRRTSLNVAGTPVCKPKFCVGSAAFPAKFGWKVSLLHGILDK